jgi:hypothetical protein
MIFKDSTVIIKKEKDKTIVTVAKLLFIVAKAHSKLLQRGKMHCLKKLRKIICLILKLREEKNFPEKKSKNYSLAN